ncbi:hypothetical protein PC9H_009465 [Pleurotus ostreatus]|uniref:TPR-like protein n=1 Tax=Pleurotus ostreatus TaxID=5322 RepID=A0A8H6ZPR5_PLEOS|nr:uncharacterized protein PC9H_009465 [Pleurotus ostreatus]KAF7424162.1 hypothetical protein PC9H_009465 [Pleurotus ostreatus]KAJ8692986.1 hypothetical protein PTI98_010244 [Pleurotus ostreatus]
MASSNPVSVEEKVATAKQHKDVADQAFKAGNTKDALRSYHQALLYLLGLDKNAMQGLGMGAPPPPAGEEVKQERTEIDEIVEKVYANMSACHIKHSNWQRAAETAEKALAKNDKNYKAMFRKGKALGEQGFFEKAMKVLEDLKSKSPEDAAAADAEMTRLRIIDNERERVHKQKMKGFLKQKSLSVTEESISS